MLKGIIVAMRPGTDDQATLERMRVIEVKYRLPVKALCVSGPDISSSGIRKDILEGWSVASLMPARAHEYLGQRGLYLEKLRDHLKSEMPNSRYTHVLGVEEMACVLAERFSVDVMLARLAALLHDCAKLLTLEEMRTIVKRCGIPVDADETQLDKLLHAPAGAALAEAEYGVKNPDVLSAIRWHTVGRRNMTPLEKVIYAADAIEPGREDVDGLSTIRKAALRDIDETVYLVAKRKAHYVQRRGFAPSRHTEELISTYNVEGIK